MTHPPSLYESLTDLARESVRQLDDHSVAGRLVDGTISREHYAAYLIQVVQQIRGSAPMLRSAGHRLRERGNERLAVLLACKGDEEDGHDRWALSDLRALGANVEEGAVQPPSPAVEAYRAYCHYLVEMAPAGVLGLAWVLEWYGYCRAGRAAQNLVRRGRIPHIRQAVSFLEGHGDADRAHVETLASVLRDVTDSDDASAILLAARVTTALYSSFFDWAARVPPRAA